MSKIVCHKTSPRPLYKSEKKLELLVAKDKSDEWTDAFKEIGVYQDVKGSTLSLNSKSEEVRCPTHIGTARRLAPSSNVSYLSVKKV
jgi:hypothetical protein